MFQERKPDGPLLGIGASLQAIRESAGISRRKMEMTANIGQSVLGRIENGRAACSSRTMHAYLEACGVDFAELLATAIKGSEKAEKPKAGRPKKKGYDHSLLPPMDWDWNEMEGCWKAVEVMNGHQKTYRVWDDGKATMKAGVRENEGEKVWHGALDKDGAIYLINDWRFYDGYQLPT